MKKKVHWITETAVMLALLVAVQALTSGLGNQFVTGSCVNLILAVTAILIGLWSGAAVAVVSPFLASAFGIGPKFVQLLPAVALGNLVFVLVWYFAAGRKQSPIWQQVVGWIGGAAAKFITLYVLMGKLLVPTLVSSGVIPEKASGVLIAQFSWPQFVTALIGGAMAMVIVPILKKALHRT